MEAHYATIWEAIADTIGDHDAVVQGSVRRTWADYERRAARLAGAFAEAGVSAGGKVALCLYNGPEYLEALVGDPFARPMARALEDEAGTPRDLSSLIAIASAGAMFSREVKDALVARLSHVTIVDLIAATEGGMGMSIHTRDRPAGTASFRINPGARVFREDGAEVTPGAGEIGMVAVSGGVPLGYYKDAEKSARTFRQIDGVRWSFPGDFATVEADGTITLLGRGSQVINSGGEKVFAEEVEEALKTHPSVEDCIVVGLPDERFGQRVAAVVALTAAASEGDLIAHVKARLAAYKAPKQVVVVERVPRAANGKADYKTARAMAAAAQA